MIRPRIPWMLFAALLLFLAVLGVSRLADFGIIDGAPYGADESERNQVEVSLSRKERLELTYGPTRYPYVWIVAVDSHGRAQPLVASRQTQPQGETLALDHEAERFRLICYFFAVPRTLEQIQESLDRDVRLPGLRYSWMIEPSG